MKRITRVTLYTLNPDNPRAEELMVDQLQRTLALIPGTELIFGPALHSPRDVVISNGKWIKQTRWRTKEDYNHYCQDPLLIEWCRFVLAGWNCKGTTLSDRYSRGGEFITKILEGGLSSHQWSRDPEVPENEVMILAESAAEFEYESGVRFQILPSITLKLALKEVADRAYPIPWNMFIDVFFGTLLIRQEFDSPDHLAEAIAYAMAAAMMSAPADQTVSLRINARRIVSVLAAGDIALSEILLVQLFHKLRWS